MTAYYNVAGARYIVAGLENGLLVTVDTVGQIVTSLPGSAAGRAFNFARFGSPGAENVYASNGADPVRRFDGATWADGSILATVNGVPNQADAARGRGLRHRRRARLDVRDERVEPADRDRVRHAALAGPGGAATTPSRVYASNPGQPEVWETDGAPARRCGRATSSTSRPVTASRSWPPSRGAN
jgi:hypothetical protein